MGTKFVFCQNTKKEKCLTGEGEKINNSIKLKVFFAFFVLLFLLCFFCFAFFALLLINKESKWDTKME